MKRRLSPNGSSPLCRSLHCLKSRLDDVEDRGQNVDFLVERIPILQEEYGELLDEVRGHLNELGVIPNVIHCTGLHADISGLIAKEVKLRTAMNGDHLLKSATSRLLFQFGTSEGGLDEEKLVRWLYENGECSGLFHQDQFLALQDIQLAPNVGMIIEESIPSLLQSIRRKQQTTRRKVSFRLNGMSSLPQSIIQGSVREVIDVRDGQSSIMTDDVDRETKARVSRFDNILIIILTILITL